MTKTLKLVDTPAKYEFQRVADVAREVQAEANQSKKPGKGPGKGLALAHSLEMARLKEKLENTQKWSKAWKDAAKINRHVVNDLGRLIHRAEEEIIRQRTTRSVIVGEPCPTCGYFVPDGKKKK